MDDSSPLQPENKWLLKRSVTASSKKVTRTAEWEGIVMCTDMGRRGGGLGVGTLWTVGAERQMQKQLVTAENVCVTFFIMHASCV